MTKLITSYKDVNYNKIEFLGQTNATVKTNNTALQLPLLITKANITSLVGLEWMKRLGIALNTTMDSINIHNINLDDTKKRILKLENEVKNLFCNKTEIKNLSVKTNLKEDASIIQQKGRPIPIHLQDQEADEIKRLLKMAWKEQSKQLRKDKLVKSALYSRKLNGATIKRKAQMQNMAEILSRISRKLSEGKDGEI